MRLPLASYYKTVAAHSQQVNFAKETKDPVDAGNRLQAAAQLLRQAAQQLDAVRLAERQLRTDGFSCVIETGPEDHPDTQEPILIGDYRTKEHDL